MNGETGENLCLGIDLSAVKRAEVQTVFHSGSADIYFHQQISTMKTVNHSQNDLKGAQRNGKALYIQRISITKNANTTKSDLQIQYNFHENSNDFFYISRNNSAKVCMELKNPQILKAILSQMNVTGDVTVSTFKIYHIVTISKAIEYWHKNTYTDQRKIINSWKKPKASRTNISPKSNNNTLKK